MTVERQLIKIRERGSARSRVQTDNPAMEYKLRLPMGTGW